MPRLLLLIPTRSYRAQAFLDAARTIETEITVASEEPNTLEHVKPGGFLTLSFQDPDAAARATLEFARHFHIDAVVAVDDDTTVVAAAIAQALSLPFNSVPAAVAAHNKHQMRQALQRAGVPIPQFFLYSADDDPTAVADHVTFPCVLKPLILSASRGVIRADDAVGFVHAFRRLAVLLRSPDVAARGPAAGYILAESYVPGQEVAVEGLLRKGQLEVLALFDKPDPLEGPFFEETILITPSRLPGAIQEAIYSCTDQAAQALGLQDGPIHAELRVNDAGPWLIEIAARSIGGLCSRTLRFGTGMSLEEVILRHSLGLEIPSLEREHRAAGAVMVPIPRAGILVEVRGQDAAQAVPGIEEVVITAHLGQELVPLPEGGAYLGFIFARGDTPAQVESALRQAHARMEFVITNSLAVSSQ